MIATPLCGLCVGVDTLYVADAVLIVFLGGCLDSLSVRMSGVFSSRNAMRSGSLLFMLFILRSATVRVMFDVCLHRCRTVLIFV